LLRSRREHGSLALFPISEKYYHGRQRPKAQRVRIMGKANRHRSGIKFADAWLRNT